MSVPVGQYDTDKLLNNGTNRWSIKPELGISKALGPLILELAAGATFYTDNDDFFGGKTRTQDPLYSVQGHAITHVMLENNPDGGIARLRLYPSVPPDLMWVKSSQSVRHKEELSHATDDKLELPNAAQIAARWASSQPAASLQSSTLSTRSMRNHTALA